MSVALQSIVTYIWGLTFVVFCTMASCESSNLILYTNIATKAMCLNLCAPSCSGFRCESKTLSLSVTLVLAQPRVKTAFCACAFQRVAAACPTASRAWDASAAPPQSCDSHCIHIAHRLHKPSRCAQGSRSGRPTSCGSMQWSLLACCMRLHRWKHTAPVLAIVPPQSAVKCQDKQEDKDCEHSVAAVGFLLCLRNRQAHQGNVCGNRSVH
jgi:hypothetical protein